MQQQIQAEGSPHLTPPRQQKPFYSSNPLQSIQNDHPFSSLDHNPANEQLISQHYQQDFDQISERIGTQTQEIREELNNSTQNIPPLNFKKQPEQQRNNDQQLLTRQCSQMLQKIREMQQKIKMHELKQLQESQERNQYQNEIEKLQSLKRINQQIQEKQERQQMFIVTNRVGTNAFSIQYIINETPLTQKNMIQERLLNEVEALRFAIQQTQGDIMKLRREIKKNGQILPKEEAQKQEMYKKCKSIYRQVEGKKQRIEANNQKISELDSKIIDSSQKVKRIDEKCNYKSIQEPTEYREKYNALLKQRQTQKKLLSIGINNSQNIVNTLRKNIKDFKKEISSMAEQIALLTQKNTGIETDSEIMLQKYKSCNVSPTISKKSNCQELCKSQIRIIAEPTTSIMIRKRKNYSQNKKIPLPINRNKSNSFLTELQVPQNKTKYSLKKKIEPNYSLQAEIQDKLNESATDVTLHKKQFKLKLPSETLKKSQKSLNVSVESQRQLVHPYLLSKKVNTEKMSVTQRLEKIEFMQKQDRIKSYKLYSLKQHSYSMKKQRDNARQQSQRSTDLDLQYISQRLDCKKVQNLNSSINLQKVEKNIQSSDQQEAGILMKLNKNQSQVTNRKQISQEITTNRSRFMDTKFTGKLLPQTDFPHPHNLFDSIQNKILSRQSSLRQSLIIQQKQPQNKTQTEICAQEEMTQTKLINPAMTRLPIFQRRNKVKQKRISNDYMRILQQRGRKILELDNECEEV